MTQRSGHTVATEVQARDLSRGEPRECAFVLTVTAGPDVGRAFRLDPAQPTRVLIGTSPACELRLTDREASRRHAAIDRVGVDLRVTDLGSTNGTFVDRVKVLQADLQGGEFLRVGATMFRVDLEDEPAADVPLTDASAFGRAMGASREMRRLYPLCVKLAGADVPLVIEGETGTGKEMLAESIHEMGPRASGPFIVFDCTAVPPALVESELFGHERGAFTGAVATRRGVFEQAHGGTLLIDEIGDLDATMQPKLLRALERMEIRRVGGDRWIRIDVRVLAATRRDLDREVQAGRFRDDLFHRLAVARIELPPLRSRRGDVAVLAQAFWRQLGGDARGPSPELLRKWEDDPWPGNVRELRNVVARTIALGDMPDELFERPSLASPPASAEQALDTFVDAGLPYPQARDRVLDAFDQRFVERLLARHGGDVARAAAASGIGRRYFQKLRARTAK
ncbi:MAG: sigma 54-dependent Fis family transcriptional regulator [Myxococcales bacterium]|nr:sigma 54-dependent Fis family transcriptional regulator [Myxococcales bacterium]